MSTAPYRAALPAVAEEGLIHRIDCSAGPIPERGLAAGRIQPGTPPATGAYTGGAGQSFVLEYGVDRIRDRVFVHTERLIDGLRSRGFTVRTPREDQHRGAVVNGQVETPATAEAALLDRRDALPTRAGGLRLFFYNTTAESDQAIEAIADVAAPTGTA